MYELIFILDVNICIGKAWTTIDRKLTIWKSDLSDKIKQEFFQAVAISILLHGCTTKTLIKCLAKKLNENITKMLHGVFNKSWKPHLAMQLYSHLAPISQIIQIRWTSMLSTAGEVLTNSEAKLSCGMIYLDSPVLANQQKLTFISSVQMLDIF